MKTFLGFVAAALILFLSQSPPAPAEHSTTLAEPNLAPLVDLQTAIDRTQPRARESELAPESGLLLPTPFKSITEEKPPPAVKLVQQNCPGGVCPLPAPRVTYSQPRVTVRTYSSASSCPGGVCPTAPTGYQARWQNHDGLSFEDHARIMHGIDTSGMRPEQIAMLRDHDHDTFGGGHSQILAMRAGGGSVTASGGRVYVTRRAPVRTYLRSGGWFPGKAIVRFFRRR